MIVEALICCMEIKESIGKIEEDQFTKKIGFISYVLSNSKLFQSTKQIIQNQQLEEKRDNSQDIIQINNMNGTEKNNKMYQRYFIIRN